MNLYCEVSNTHAKADIEKTNYWLAGTHFRTITSYYFQLEAATNIVRSMHNGTYSHIIQECKEVLLFNSYAAVLNNSQHHTGSVILSFCRTIPALVLCRNTTYKTVKMLL
jgi:hypothetical protein